MLNDQNPPINQYNQDSREGRGPAPSAHPRSISRHAGRRLQYAVAQRQGAWTQLALSLAAGRSNMRPGPGMQLQVQRSVVSCRWLLPVQKAPHHNRPACSASAASIMMSVLPTLQNRPPRAGSPLSESTLEVCLGLPVEDWFARRTLPLSGHGYREHCHKRLMAALPRSDWLLTRGSQPEGCTSSLWSPCLAVPRSVPAVRPAFDRAIQNCQSCASLRECSLHAPPRDSRGGVLSGTACSLRSTWSKSIDSALPPAGAPRWGVSVRVVCRLHVPAMFMEAKPTQHAMIMEAKPTPRR